MLHPARDQGQRASGKRAEKERPIVGKRLVGGMKASCIPPQGDHGSVATSLTDAARSFPFLEFTVLDLTLR